MRLRGTRFYLIVALLLGVVCLPWWSMRDGEAKQFVNEIRELKKQRLHYARAYDVLKDYSFVVSATSDRPETVESLTLSLRESLKHQSNSLKADMTGLSVNNSHDTAPPVLRVEFNVIVPRATDLLAIFDAVRDVADWRPMEVRGCTLLRGVELNGLHSVCTVDVYYFPDIDT